MTKAVQQSPLKSSEPRVLVLGGVRERWTAEQRRNDSHYLNGIETWVFAFDGDYCWHGYATPKLIEQYDIVICNTNDTHNDSYCLHYRRLAENRPAHVRWVSLLEGSMLDYIKPQRHTRGILDASDLVNCINRHAMPMIQALTSAPVAYIGMPYPVEGVRKYVLPIAERQRRVFLCFFLLLRWNDYLVAKNLGLPYYGSERVISRRWKSLKRNWQEHQTLMDKDINLRRARQLYGDTELQILPTTSMHNYFQQNANSYLWLNLDERYTWGRSVLDAAALGIPVITTASTGHGDILFPKTTVATPFDVDKAIDIGKQLIHEPDFYLEVSEYAFEKLAEDYTEAVMKKKLLDSLNS